MPRIIRRALSLNNFYIIKGDYKPDGATLHINISAKELWDFISEILTLGLGCVKSGGRYLTHVSGKAVPATRETFRETVMAVSRNIGIEVSISFSEAFVPSFMESWVFAQITVVTPA